MPSEPFKPPVLVLYSSPDPKIGFGTNIGKKVARENGLCEELSSESETETDIPPSKLELLKKVRKGLSELTPLSDEQAKKQLQLRMEAIRKEEEEAARRQQQEEEEEQEQEKARNPSSESKQLTRTGASEIIKQLSENYQEMDKQEILNLYNILTNYYGLNGNDLFDAIGFNQAMKIAEKL